MPYTMHKDRSLQKIQNDVITKQRQNTSADKYCRQFIGTSLGGFKRRYITGCAHRNIRIEEI